MDRIGTPELAERLATACARFPGFGRVTAADLLAMVKGELGHEEILDRLCCYHGFGEQGERRARTLQFSRALPPGRLLHIFAGGGALAALHSVVCGLLIRSHNLCVLSARALPELARFRDLLPPELANEIEIHDRLPGEWIESADAVIVLGPDDAVAHFRKLCRPHQIFVGRPQRLALAIIFDDRDCASAPLVARDVSLHDQQSPLSPHVIYVASGSGPGAHAYAARLAAAMAEFNRHTPRRPLDPEQSALLANIRTSYRLRMGPESRDVTIWESEGSTDWTVVYERDPRFVVSPLNRLVFVKPLPDNLSTVLAPVRHRVSTVGVCPSTMETAERLAPLGAVRICPVGRMLLPPMTWHRDAGQVIAPLIRWLDFEPGDAPPPRRAPAGPGAAPGATQEELFST